MTAGSPGSYRVRLDAFSGPLDLLLYLVKQEEVEIHEIPIAVICDRYLETIRELREIDVDVAGEFLVMAATLMLIKSRSLLPVEDAVDLEEELDPEDELIRQLLEYKKYKVATRGLERLYEERARIRPFRPPRRGEEEIELEEIDILDLARTFAQILAETGLETGPRIVRAERPLREFIEDVFDLLRRARRMVFSRLFAGSRTRETVIGRFLALLELVRRGRVRARQVGSWDEIELELVDERELSDEEWELVEAEMSASREADEPPAVDVPPADGQEGESEAREGAGGASAR